MDQPAHRWRSADAWILALVLAAVLAGGALRLTGIADIGLRGSDNTTYTNIALRWLEGDRVMCIADTHVMYRPVVYALYAAAIRVLGPTDWSIKALNASLDTVNILLVFLLAAIVSRRDLRASGSAAVIYALLPYPILISRSELTHTVSTTTMLGAMILVALALRAARPGRRLILAALAGVATGVCALTHEELIFAAAAPAVFLAIGPLARPGPGRLRMIEAVSAAGVYLLGTTLVAQGMLLAHRADAGVRAATIVDHRATHATHLRAVERPLKFFWNALTGASSTLLACLVISLAVILVVGLVVGLRRRRTGGGFAPPAVDVLAWTVVGYLAVYPFFLTYYAVRLFLPLMPLVIVWLVVRSAGLIEARAGRRVAGVWVALLTIAVVAANLAHIVTFRASMASRFETWTGFRPALDLGLADGWSTLCGELTRRSWYRERYDELGGVVSSNARLLFGASTFHPFPGRRTLQIPFYFGDDAVHLFDHDEPLAELIERKRIAFVLFSPLQQVVRPPAGWESWQRYLYDGQWSPPGPVTLGASLGFADGEYSIGEELERLRSRMARRGARIILGQRDLLTKRPSLADPLGYIVWALDPTSWPPLARELEAVPQSRELAAAGRLDDALAVLEAAENSSSDLSRFRLRLTGARILAEHDRPAEARRRVADALSLLPRNTTVATALDEAAPDPAAAGELQRLIAGLQAKAPGDRALRDLGLALSLNLAEHALETGVPADAVAAFGSLERQLVQPGSRRLAEAVASWCAATARSLDAGGRTAEAAAARAAASAVPAARGGTPDEPEEEPEAPPMPVGEEPADDGF
ncbi:MAG: hypothetical protein MUC56_15830 [Thermoanaerobaculales bacterium]|jgi:4-amino-4-deoxy-L-arabinose transferase-like glycosyltransferase|nr:hypothetical protein [Thermoanaerobaculales bacterium]